MGALETKKPRPRTSTNTPRPKRPQHWWWRFRVLASILVSTRKASGTPVDARHSSDVIGGRIGRWRNVVGNKPGKNEL